MQILILPLGILEGWRSSTLFLLSQLCNGQPPHFLCLPSAMSMHFGKMIWQVVSEDNYDRQKESMQPKIYTSNMNIEQKWLFHYQTVWRKLKQVIGNFQIISWWWQDRDINRYISCPYLSLKKRCIIQPFWAKVIHLIFPL